MIIGAGAGIYRTRTIRRKPEEEKWSWENVRGGVYGVPWEKSEGNLQDDVEQIRVREFTDEETKILEEEKRATEMSSAAENDNPCSGYHTSWSNRGLPRLQIRD